ncbi:cache domain-containing sensor histidine kinase [Cohnella terricola]|uniref:HAMP domain-containing protein n=1 Tax=Cohnella terricola TaxID=1289167 RepID=A0A559IV89_9BACL|nr:sensor histidine kinase [Cohnella terricola]TVX91540.1 HAMP domain-containing protein [Cohnella terricola]
MRLFAFKRIQSSIAVAFSCLILLTTLILSFISYHLSADAVKKKSQDSTNEIIDQVNTSINSYISSMEYISVMALNNADIRDFIRSSSHVNLVSDNETRLRIRDYFHSVLSSHKDITSVMLFGANGSLYVSDRDKPNLKPNLNASKQTWFVKAKEAQGLVVVSPPHIQNLYQKEYRWVITLSREIRSADDKQSLGVFSIDLDFDVINKICNDIRIGSSGYLFIVDEVGKIIYHPQQQILYSNLKSEMIDQVLSSDTGSFTTDEGNESRMYMIKKSGYGWNIVGVAYLNELVSNKQEMQQSLFLWGFVCLMIGLVLAILLSRRLSSPVKRLEACMREIEKGNFDIRSDILSVNEIGKLSLRFNMMIGKIRELMDRIMVEQEFKRKSEMKALQAQINPHFLYNTLGSIVWMAEKNKMEEVVTMTVALGNLFRASIGKGSELIPIQAEMEHIKHYLTIQKIRYKSMDYQIHVDDRILNFKTLRLILQPLVENCIYHGIKYKTGTGIIQVTGELMEDCILLKVIDNGIGMQEEQRERILLQDEPFEDKGVGVTNVNERLRLAFGERYGLSYNSVLGKGTEVTVCIPIID